MEAIKQITIDHKTIKAWAEKYGGKPQLVEHPAAGSDAMGLRIDFPGEKDDAFLSDSKPSRDISWEEFFRLFDEQKLAFQYVDNAEADNVSWSYHFIPRENVE